MKTKRLLFGTLAGTVSIFLLGALIYGMLLSGYMEANTNQAVARPMDQMNVGAMILSNLLWALLIALVVDWSNSTSFSGGFKVGAIVGALAMLGFDFTMYATSTLYNDISVVFVDSICFAVMTGVSGGLIGWVMSKAGAANTAVA
jgi:hypothetical protein